MPSIRLTAPSENAVLYGTPGGVINLLIKGNCDDTGAPDGLGVTTVEAGGPPLTVDASDGTFQRTVPLSTRGQLVVKATIHWSTANPSGPTKPPIHHSASASRTVTLVDDTVGPTIAIVSPQRNASLPIAELGGSFELRVNVQDVGVGLANPAVIEWSLDGSVGSGFVADSAPPGSYVAIVPWPIRLRVPGEDVVNVRAQDAAGNWSDWASVDFFVFDNTAPSASITSPIDLYRVAIGQSLFIEGTVTDRQSGVKQLEWSFEDGTPVVAQSWPAPAVPNTNGVPWSLRIDPSNLPAPGGPYTLTLRFTDWSGNSATTPLQVEVLRQVVPLNAGDLIGSREYLRALLSFSKAHVRRGEGAAFIDDELLAAIFGQNFSALSTSLSASNIAPVNQARLCIEILRTQLSTLPGFDPTPPTDYLDAAYDSLLRQIGTSHDELRLIRGADPERKLTLTRRLGIGDDIAKLDRLLLRRGEDLTEAMLQRLFGFQVSGVSGGTSVSNEDGEFFTWQQTQRRLEWANADRALPWPLIDPDVVGRQGLSGDASTAQFALWSSRRQQVKQREAALRSILAASQSFTPLQALNSLVADAFSTWAPADQVLRRLEQLVDLVDNQGQRIDRQLAALFLDISCLRRLARVASLARAATDWRDLSGQDFDDVVHILVRVWKLRQHSIWRIEEGAQGISLSSIFFRLSLDTPPSLPNTGFLDGAAIGAGNNATGWTVTIPAGGPPAGLPKVVRTQPAVWLTDDGKSRWINPSGDGNDLLPAGEYVYATRIDLDGWDLSTVELTVGVAVDDVLSAISITSTEEPGVTRRIDVGVSGYSTFHWVAIDAGILFSGINEIAFHVVNGGASANPTGLRVEFHWGGSPNRIRTSAWRWVAPALRQLPAPDAVTGRTGSVTGTPDQLWAITASPTGAPALGPAFISATTAAGWLDNTSSTGSRWISPLADGSANLPSGEYVFEGTLDLTGWNLDGMTIELKVAAADSLSDVTVQKASGQQTVFGLAAVPTAFRALRLDSTAFAPGTNTLRFRVQNTTGGATGLRVELLYLRAPSLQAWPAAPALRDDWQNVLVSRLDEETSRAQGVADVLQAVEKGVLPTLRDRMVGRFARVNRMAPSDAAEWLGERYLIETRGDAWRITTRVLQATESIQALVAALRDKSLQASHPAAVWQIATRTSSAAEADSQDEFDREWEWMRSYAAWRSAMLIFYYPENLLLPNLRSAKEQTAAFLDLLKNLRAKARLSPKTAAGWADTYWGATGGTDAALVLRPNRIDSELIEFRSALRRIWNATQDVQAKGLLDEVYWCVPITLALQLQKSGEFEVALDWLRTVYDYQAPTDDTRKIYPGLSEEHNLAPTLNQGVHWLREALDPHSFARQRWPLDGQGNPPTNKQANPYTRFTMICVARCLIEFGDSEFTRDSGESLANARALYLVGRDVLNRPDFDEVQPVSASQILLPNPVLGALRARVDNQLRKMRLGRNAAGMKRDIELPAPPTTLSGAPSISGSGTIVLAGDRRVDKATPYRFAVLMDRAKQLVGIAQQMEGAYLSALEKLDAENYNLKKAGFDLNLAAAGVKLQEFRVTEASESKKLSEKQKSRASKQRQTYQDWIDQGMSAWEIGQIAAIETAGAARATAAVLDGLITIASMAQATASANFGAAASAGIGAATTPAIIARSIVNGVAAEADAQTQVLSMQASFQRRENDWALSRDLAALDEDICDEQIAIAGDHIIVANQEKAIADLQNSQASDIAKFLATKFTNTELYEWMSGVLGSVYCYFLQQATAVATLAQQQLGFERQESPGAIVQDDYWEVPTEPSQTDADSSKKDRRGLTGSARLLQDIYRLDQFAFESNKRKLNLTHTLSLAMLNPQGFAQFREFGVLGFTTTSTMFDEAFPGHYLRLIKRVRVSVVALIPPVAGIRATLGASGVSYIVTGGDTFQEVTVRRDPELVALSSPTNATGVFELDAQTELLMPFESMGVATMWEFSMPKAANAFDYESLVDVLITLEYTALNDNDYRQQVMQRLPRQVSATRAYSLRNDFPDIWYALCNPTPGAAALVSYRTERQHFPPNMENLSAKDLLVALIPDSPTRLYDGEVTLNFIPDGTPEVPGGNSVSATFVENRISTATSAAAWRPLVTGRPAVGRWEFQLSSPIAGGIASGEIKDVLIVLTFTGLKPAWPAA